MINNIFRNTFEIVTLTFGGPWRRKFTVSLALNPSPSYKITRVPFKTLDVRDSSNCFRDILLMSDV